MQTQNICLQSGELVTISTKTKRRFGRLNSISTKLVLIYFFIMLITLLFFSYYITGAMKNHLYADEKVSAITMSSVVASFAGDYIDSENGVFEKDGFIIKVGRNNIKKVSTTIKTLFMQIMITKINIKVKST